jgi:hypothetical protein
MTASRRDLLLGRLFRPKASVVEQVVPGAREVEAKAPPLVGLRAFKPRAPLSAEQPQDEAPPPWSRRS